MVEEEERGRSLQYEEERRKLKMLRYFHLRGVIGEDSKLSLVGNLRWIGLLSC